MPRVSEEDFQEILQAKLGSDWERASKVFREFGANRAIDVVNVLLHAVDKNKVDEVLGILEEHYQKHLQFQHPEIRGAVSNDLGINETEKMFLGICKVTLGLQPSA